MLEIERREKLLKLAAGEDKDAIRKACAILDAFEEKNLDVTKGYLQNDVKVSVDSDAAFIALQILYKLGNKYGVRFPEPTDKRVAEFYALFSFTQRLTGEEDALSQQIAKLRESKKTDEECAQIKTPVLSKEERSTHTKLLQEAQEQRRIKIAERARQRREAVEQLLEMGFGECLIRKRLLFALGLPFPPYTAENAALLGKYIDLSSIEPDEDRDWSRLSLFLRRSPEKNRFMASVPELLDFSDAERDAYESDPLAWSIGYDIRPETVPTLGRIVRSSGAVDSIIRRIYCSKGMMPPDRIPAVCESLAGLDADPNELEAFVCENARSLFGYYSETVDFIETAARLFGRDHVYTILKDDPERVRRFETSPIDTRKRTISELREEYPQYCTGSEA